MLSIDDIVRRYREVLPGLLEETVPPRPSDPREPAFFARLRSSPSLDAFWALVLL